MKKLIFWAPRILAILFILFIAMFSLDVFGHYGFWETMLALLIHNIPALILLIALIISWKYEIVGGIVFILGGLFYIAMLLPKFKPHMFTWVLFISGPAFVVGILFLIGWIYKKKVTH
jgi:hypothetical protein